ncbi:MAG: hypothetical protein R3B93_22785 [Bacteroidia bacterium]
MNIYTKSLFALAITALFISGCEVLNFDLEKNTEVVSATDHVFMQSEFTTLTNTFDLMAQSVNSLNPGEDIEGVLGICSVTKVEVSLSGTIMNMDFGTGCKCVDGKFRSGMIKATFDKDWNTDGVTMTLTSENYKVTSTEDITYEADFTATIMRTDIQSDKPVYDIKVEDASYVSDNGTITWKSERQVVWVEGAGDLDPTNEVYEITEQSEGVASNEVPFTVKIDTPLRLEASCEYITAGTITMTPEGRKDRVMDYGDGTCDNLVKVSIGSFGAEIKL